LQAKQLSRNAKSPLDRILGHWSRRNDQALSEEKPSEADLQEARFSTRDLLHRGTGSAHAFFDFTVNTHAAMMVLNDIFFNFAVGFVLIIPLVWITKPAMGGGSVEAAVAH
jgi:hypothetical protein